MTDPGTRWLDFWARAAALDALGQEWVFQGQVEGDDLAYSGPHCDLAGRTRLRLTRDHTLVGEIVWTCDQAEPVWSPVDGESPAWPLTLANMPTRDHHVPAWVEQDARVLWVDYEARQRSLRAIWLDHVQVWREQGLGPDSRYTMGVTMHGRAVLHLDAYDGAGNIVVAFTYPALSGEVPRVEYFD